MTFESDKQNCLEKLDKSRKGSVDAGIKPIMDIISQSRDYYTTSSCAGRIMALAPGINNKKHEVMWLFCSHNPVKSGELMACLKGLPKRDVFLKQEGMILHVRCRDLAAAKLLLVLVRDLGFKRAGIIALGNKIIIEIVGSEHLEAMIARNGKLLVDEAYICEAANEANKRLNANTKKMKALGKKLKADL